MKYKICANCHKEIEEEYYFIGDNFLQLKYFEALDGSDNIFCSHSCICESLSVVSEYVNSEEQK